MSEHTNNEVQLLHRISSLEHLLGQISRNGWGQATMEDLMEEKSLLERIDEALADRAPFNSSVSQLVEDGETCARELENIHFDLTLGRPGRSVDPNTTAALRRAMKTVRQLVNALSGRG